MEGREEGYSNFGGRVAIILEGFGEEKVVFEKCCGLMI